MCPRAIRVLGSIPATPPNWRKLVEWALSRSLRKVRCFVRTFLTPEQIERWPAINVVGILVHAPFVRRTPKRLPGVSMGVVIRE
jgi:hypothetical protein